MSTSLVRVRGGVVPYVDIFDHSTPASSGRREGDGSPSDKCPRTIGCGLVSGLENLPPNLDDYTMKEIKTQK